ncbi:Chloride intracellular channel protein 6 [Blomia tropicalis]|nr:Chloride intracellular channel protein 6 [Blomia tropicalis]
MDLPIEIFVKERELLSHSLRRQMIRSPIIHKWNCSTFTDENIGGEAMIETELLKELNPNASPIGACPLSHELLMLLSLKQKLLGQKRFRFNVHLIDASKWPSQFFQYSFRHIPAIYDPNRLFASDNFTDILSYLDEQYPTMEMLPKFSKEEHCQQVVKLCCKLFRRFYGPVVDQRLHSWFTQLDTILLQYDGTFCSNDINQLTNIDTEILPMLHQMRIIIRYLYGDDITNRYNGIANYMIRAYNRIEFAQWCPSDQEIIFMCQIKPNIVVQRREMIRLIKAEPTFSLSVSTLS